MQARGNAASRAFSIDKAGFRAASNADLAQPARKDNQLSSAESLDALDRALSASPVDLCCIAEEMCAQPQFATMVMRLASSLLVSPEKSATTIEEAVVALGTDRLRALLHIWSRYRQRRIADSVPSQSGSMAPGVSPVVSAGVPNDKLFVSQEGEATPEPLFLATFLRDLGSDASAPSVASIAARLLASAGQASEFSELSDLFRDCVSAAPRISSVTSESIDSQTVAGEALCSSDGKECE